MGELDALAVYWLLVLSETGTHPVTQVGHLPMSASQVLGLSAHTQLSSYSLLHPRTCTLPGMTSGRFVYSSQALSASLWPFLLAWILTSYFPLKHKHPWLSLTRRLLECDALVPSPALNESSSDFSLTCFADPKVAILSKLC